jgi:hypothetical protein
VANNVHLEQECVPLVLEPSQTKMDDTSVLIEKILYRNNNILFRNNPKSRNLTKGIASICIIQ